MDANPFAADDWQRMTELLPSNWRDRAETLDLCRSLPSARGERAKLKDPGLLLRLVLHHVATETSLAQTTAQAHAAGLVTVSPVALHKRMRTVAPWLAEMAADLTPSSAPDRAFRYLLKSCRTKS